MTATPGEIHLQLRNLKNFFRVPEVDPFEGETIDLSGIDQVMDALRVQKDWRTSRAKAVIWLPEGTEDDALVRQLPRALATYCESQIQYCRRKMLEVRLEGRRALRVGAIFLAACLALSTVLDHWLGSDSLLGYLFGEGLLIAGWVGLWHPLELLLYSWWPYSSDIKLYEKIKGMEISVRYGAMPPQA